MAASPSLQPLSSQLPLQAHSTSPLEPLQVPTLQPAPSRTVPINTAPLGSQTRKRKATSAPTASSEPHTARRKDAHSRLENLLQALDAAAHPPPTYAPPAPTPVSTTPHLRSAAVDIWYHIAPASMCTLPNDFDTDQQIINDVQYQDSKPFRAFRCPTNCEYLRCVPCLANGSWHIWLNRPSGNTRAIRDHMVKYHPEEYTAKCKQHGIDITAVNPDDEFDAPQPPFTRDGLVERIARWIAVDDQALSVVEQPEFRDILLYCGQGVLHDIDVPHRSKIAFEMHGIFLREKQAIIAEMQNSLGCISLTSDLWSDQLLRSFMAVTAHYINSRGDLAAHLVAFCKIDGAHTGANVGQALFAVINEINITQKIGQITLDNASNNDTLMQELATAFRARGLHFDPEENRVR